MTFTKYYAIILITIFLFPQAELLSQERVIKPGDVIEIIVYAHEDLNQTVIVNQEGKIDFPSLQGLPIDGISLQRFQEILVAQLSRYMESTPLVMVRFSETYPIRVTVLGQIAVPGLYPIANTVSLQGAIGAAGGFIPGAQLSKIKVIRTINKEKTFIDVNIEQFYKSGDPSSLPLLKDGDTIIVPGNPLATKVIVLGSVVAPGNYDVFSQTTLLDVIFMAGGPTDDANLNSIKIASFTGQDTREIRLNIKDLLKTKNFQNIPIVVPGDVVFVSKKKINWTKIITIIRDITTFAMLYFIIARSRDL